MRQLGRNKIYKMKQPGRNKFRMWNSWYGKKIMKEKSRDGNVFMTIKYTLGLDKFGLSNYIIDFVFKAWVF